jgi:hypothetical protein
MNAGVAPSEGRHPTDEHLKLAEFVGRLYLFLFTVVFDHPRWLPKRVRPLYKSALAEVYPSVRELQLALLSKRPMETEKRLVDAGLSGSQLTMKLTLWREAEARFYGQPANSLDEPNLPPDRYFPDKPYWRLPELEPVNALEDRVRLLEEMMLGGGHLSLKSASDAVFPPANTILGSLLSIFLIAEPYKEIKEGVEYAVRQGKVLRRIVASTGGAVVRLVRRIRRRPTAVE